MFDFTQPLTLRDVTLANRVFLAPVDGVFDYATRKLYLDFHPGLTHSEVTNARALTYNAKKAWRAVRRSEQERPFSIQLADHEAQPLAEMARRIQEEGHAELVDLNMGCPSRTTTNSGNGCALMKSPVLVAEILSAMRTALTSLPLTAKFRAGWDDSNRNALEIAHICEEEGVDLITVHGRTRKQMYTGKADWDIIAAVKQQARIPVIGNGDVVSAATAQEMIAHTGCDGVMIARGAFGNPWLIQRILQNDDGFSVHREELIATLFRHYQYAVDDMGELAGIRFMRKHILAYIHNFPAASRFRNWICQVESHEGIRQAVTDYFTWIDEVFPTEQAEA